MKKHFREWSVAFALGLLLLFLAVLAPTFFVPAQLLSLLAGAMPVILAACGAALVIICRQVDISIGSQFAVCSVLLGLAARAGWPMPAVTATALLCGACFGAFNGLMVAGLELPSIVVTLATMVTWREALEWWREGAFVRDLPERFQWFGLRQGTGQAALILATTAVFLFLATGMKHLSAGRYCHATGSDAESARLAGIHPRLVTFLVFVLMGALSGLAALFNAVRFSDVDPKTGTGLELQAIAAAVVGGVAVSGGRGNLWGVLAGVMLLVCIGPALVFLRWPPQWEKAFQGCVILLAVAADSWRSKTPKR